MDDEELSLDEAATAYAKTDESDEPVDDGQSEDEALADGEQAEDELPDEGEEEEGETEDDGQAEDEDQDDDAEEDYSGGRFAADSARVKLEDGTIVSISDLKNGTLRQADYTKGKMDLSEQRRTVELQSERNTQLEQQLTQSQELAMGILEGLMPQEPDIAMMDPNSPSFDPLRHASEKAHYDQRMVQLQKLQTDRQQRQQTDQEQNNAKSAENIRVERDSLLRVMPQFKDQRRYTTFMNNAVDFGSRHGYSQQEIHGMKDHRAYVIMDKAIKWDTLQANKSKVKDKVKGRPPVQRGGKRSSPSAQRTKSANAAMDRLKKTGTEQDAVAVYLASQKG